MFHSFPHLDGSTITTTIIAKTITIVIILITTINIIPHSAQVGLICFTVLPHLEDLIRGIVLAYTALIPGGRFSVNSLLISMVIVMLMMC